MHSKRRRLPHVEHLEHVAVAELAQIDERSFSLSRKTTDNETVGCGRRSSNSHAPTLRAACERPKNGSVLSSQLAEITASVSTRNQFVPLLNATTGEPAAPFDT